MTENNPDVKQPIKFQKIKEPPAPPPAPNLKKCSREVIAMVSLHGEPAKPICNFHLKKAKAFAKIFDKMELKIDECDGNGLKCAQEE